MRWLTGGGSGRCVAEAVYVQAGAGRVRRRAGPGYRGSGGRVSRAVPGRDRRAVEQTVMAVVAAGRAMEDRTVVPHDERVRLPLVAIAEWLAALPLHQFVEEGQRLRLVHVFDADDVAGAAEQSLAAGFGVLAGIGLSTLWERVFPFG